MKKIILTLSVFFLVGIASPAVPSTFRGLDENEIATAQALSQCPAELLKLAENKAVLVVGTYWDSRGSGHGYVFNFQKEVGPHSPAFVSFQLRVSFRQDQPVHCSIERR
jgi:hypothetical protein